jgi:ubiquinone/menaquinone biosynthesis C-methylase UbiE
MKVATKVEDLLKEGKKLRLDVGAGLHPKEGFITLDNSEACNPDILCDLDNESIPLPDDSVKEVWANYILEHCKDHLKVMDEIWRVCEPGALVQLNVPHVGWDGAVTDPQHKSYFTQHSIDYWDTRRQACSDWGNKSKFDLVHLEQEIDPFVANMSDQTTKAIALQFWRNVIQKIKFTLRVVK